MLGCFCGCKRTEDFKSYLKIFFFILFRYSLVGQFDAFVSDVKYSVLTNFWHVHLVSFLHFNNQRGATGKFDSLLIAVAVELGENISGPCQEHQVLVSLKKIKRSKKRITDSIHFIMFHHVIWSIYVSTGDLEDNADVLELIEK